MRLFLFLMVLLTIPAVAQVKKGNPAAESRNAPLEMLKQVKATLGKYDYHQKVKFVNNDGLTGYYLQTSKKTSFESDAFWKADNDTLSYLYEFPKPMRDSVDKKNNGVISFYPPGGENILSAFSWEKVARHSGDTIIIPFDTARQHNPYHKQFDWTHPGNFKNYARAWIFPEGMKPVSYRCNRTGTWSLNRNVLQFIADPNQNEFNFELKYLKRHVRISQLEGRPVTYIKEIPIETDTVFLELKDDQEEDGDIVSLFYDTEWIGKNLEVTRNPLRIILPVSTGLDGSSFVIHAENEGKVPPNTAEVTIYAGEKRYVITLSSSRSASSGIVLTRRKPR